MEPRFRQRSVCAMMDALVNAEADLATMGDSLDQMSDETIVQTIISLVSEDPADSGWDADLTAAGAFLIELLARACARKDATNKRTGAGGE